MNTPSGNPSSPSGSTGRSGNLSYWYHLSDLHGLRYFWSPFARDHRLRLSSDMENVCLRLDPMSTAPLLYEAMLVLYEILERWGLLSLLDPSPTLRCASARRCQHRPCRRRRPHGLHCDQTTPYPFGAPWRRHNPST